MQRWRPVKGQGDGRVVCDALLPHLPLPPLPFLPPSPFLSPPGDLPSVWAVLCLVLMDLHPRFHIPPCRRRSFGFLLHNHYLVIVNAVVLPRSCSLRMYVIAVFSCTSGWGCFLVRFTLFRLTSGWRGVLGVIHLYSHTHPGGVSWRDSPVFWYTPGWGVSWRDSPVFSHTWLGSSLWLLSFPSPSSLTNLQAWIHVDMATGNYVPSLSFLADQSQGMNSCGHGYRKLRSFPLFPRWPVSGHEFMWTWLQVVTFADQSSGMNSCGHG